MSARLRGATGQIRFPAQPRPRFSGERAKRRQSGKKRRTGKKGSMRSQPLSHAPRCMTMPLLGQLRRLNQRIARAGQTFLEKRYQVGLVLVRQVQWEDGLVQLRVGMAPFVVIV